MSLARQDHATACIAAPDYPATVGHMPIAAAQIKIVICDQNGRPKSRRIRALGDYLPMADLANRRCSATKR